MIKFLENKGIPGSFRDPSGFLFYRNGSIYRQVNAVYKNNYDLLINSNLYKTLLDERLLVSHEEIDTEGAEPDKAYKVLKVERIPFISYPYEWCFSQLKDAALTTLRIQKMALNYGMSLKDASAYNIQFRKCKPIFIDTLSFEKYHEGEPWVAYRQFCQHFLAPLALMSYKDIRLNQLFRIFIDGISLDLASNLLPLRTYLKFSLLSHIHIHAKSQNYFADKAVKKNNRKMSRLSFLGLIDSLEAIVHNMKWEAKGTEWSDYYQDTNYTSNGFGHKKEIVTKYLEKSKPNTVWDLGANVGIFSRIASDRGMQTLSFDIDPAAVEKNYLRCASQNEVNILPLLSDLTNPSPSIGWGNEERMSLLERGPADALFALALIHHLVISNNLPFNKIAKFLSTICKTLIIEFIPKNDSQVKRLLTNREDIFPDYTCNAFEHEFKKFFKIRDSEKIKDSERTLYLMEGV